MNTELSKTLEILAEKLGTTIEHLYVVLTNQVYADIIHRGFLVSFFAVLLVTVFFIMKKYDLLHHDYRGELQEFLSGVAIVSGIVLTLSFCISFLMLIRSVSLLMNPEYFAIMTILENLR